MNFWRTLHPKTSVVATLQPGMRGPFWFCVGAFVLLFLVLLAARVRLAEQLDEVDALYLQAGDRASA